MPTVAKPKKARSPKEYADIVSMRTERKKLYLDAVAINQKAIGEKRDMSAQEKEQFDTVTFKEDVEEFVGLDLKKYGPFKKGDTGKLPKENAELFVEKNIAKKG